MYEDGRDVESVGARHAVIAVVAIDGGIALDERCRLVLQPVLLLHGERFQGRVCAQVVLQVFHIRHAAEHGEHGGFGADVAEGPRSHAVLRLALLEVRHDVVGHLRQTSAEQGLHDNDGDVPPHQFFVEVLAGASLVLLVVPVDVVGLNLHEVPVILVVVCEGPVEDGDVAMEREAEVADAACFTLFHEPVEQSVVEVALMDRPHASAADAVQEQIVDVVGLQELQAALEHGLALLEVVLRGREVGELRGDEIVAALVSAGLQGDAQALLALSAAIGRRCVEVVDAVVEGKLAEAVYLFLVQGVAADVLLCAGTAVLHGRQAHPSIAQQTDLVALLGVGAIGHFVRWNGAFVVSHVVHLTVSVAALYATRCQSRRSSRGARDFEEVSSVNIFFHSGMFFVMTL